MSAYSPIIVTQQNQMQAIRENILRAWQALDSKVRVSRATPLPALDANGHSVRLAGLSTTLFSAVCLADLQAMLAGTYTIPPNPDAAGLASGPGIYPSKPQGDPLSPISTAQYGGRILGDTAGDGN